MPPQLAVTIRGDGVQLSPGTSAAFSIEVRNLGSVVDRYRCELVGLDPSWYTITPASMELFPQNEGGGGSGRPDAPPSTGRFQVTLHPPRTSEAKAGPWPFGAKVSSEHDPSNRRVEEGSVSFLAFGALEADVRPAVVSGRFGTNASLQLVNRGNRPETVEILGSDRAARIAFNVKRPRLTVAPGETVTVPIGLSVGGPRLIGGKETHAFSLEVRSIFADTPPVLLSGTLEKLAIVPSGLPVAIGGLVALAMGAFAIWAAFLRPPSTPAAALLTPPPPTPIVITLPPPTATPPPTAAPSVSLPPTSAPPSVPSSLPCLAGPIDLAYAAIGGPGSFLGPAISCDTTAADGGVSRNFQFGSMFVAPGSGQAFALSTPLRDYWLSIGGPASALGYPTSNAVPSQTVAGAWAAFFQKGQASFDPVTGGSNCIGIKCNGVLPPLKTAPIFVP
jgi:hypothetical protein